MDLKLQDNPRHRLEEVPKGVKIFPHGEPLPNDVIQAGVKDCYLMSTLISLAKNNKDAIKECFVQYYDNIEDKNNIVIRFFSYNNGMPKEVKIAVNKNKVIGDDWGGIGIKNGALWPKLIEKAYAVYRYDGYEGLGYSGLQEGKSLCGGFERHTMFALTGKNAHEHDTEDHTNPKFESEKIMKTIEKKLRKGRTLTCDFKDKESFYVTDVKNNEKIEIRPAHSYAIVGIKFLSEETGYIRLVEPNRINGRTKKRLDGKLSKDYGHIAMSFKDFQEHYDDISYTTNKKV